MTVPLFETRALYEPCRPAIAAAIERVVDSGRFILGEEVAAFEREFAEYLGARHVIGVGNGTDALRLALEAAGVERDDDVVVPSFTFFATAEAVVQLGARPVFCDIDPGTFCMTGETLEAALSRADGPRAVVPVHLFGNPAPMDELTEVAGRQGLALVEDAAQATGATLAGRRCGTLGTAAAFSFFPSKNLFCFGDGGAVATDDDAVAERVRLLHRHGSKDKDTFQCSGWNSRLDALQAAVLRILLPRLDEWNAGRRRAAAEYASAGLGDHVELPVQTPGGTAVHHLFVAKAAWRDRLATELAARGIAARPYYARPVHAQPALERWAPRDPATTLPGTLEAARRNVALPMSPVLSSAQVREVVEAVADLDRSD